MWIDWHHYLSTNSFTIYMRADEQLLSIVVGP